MKKWIAGLLMLIPLQIAIGQDQIITIELDTIHCRIMSVSPNYIHYEQRAENGYMIGKFIPTEQVSEYLRTTQLEELNPYVGIVRRKPEPAHRWMIGIHPGRSSMLASTANDEKVLIESGIPKSQVDNYVKQMRHGWNFSGDIHYMFSDHFGLGAKYSLFISSAQQDFTMRYFSPGLVTPIHSYMYLHVEIKEKLYIHYAAPSVIFRQWLDKNRQFQLIETLSAGYVHYRDELRQNQGLYKLNVLAESNTWGANAGLSVGYYPLPWLSVGVNTAFMYARLKKMDVSTKESTQTVELNKKDYEYLTRLDYSISIRFHFN